MRRVTDVHQIMRERGKDTLFLVVADVEGLEACPIGKLCDWIDTGTVWRASPQEEIRIRATLRARPQPAAPPAGWVHCKRCGKHHAGPAGTICLDCHCEDTLGDTQAGTEEGE